MPEDNMSKKRSRGRPVKSDAERAVMRTSIAEIAARLFEEEGFGQVSMRRIAKEVGCTPMTLYKYYDAKIDILRTLWGDMFTRVFSRLESLPRTVDKTSNLKELSLTYLDYWLENTDHYRLVFMAEGVTQPEVSLFTDDPATAKRFELFADAILAASPKPLSVDELKLRLDALICFLHGIAHNMITISAYPWANRETLVHIAVSAVTSEGSI